MIRTVLFGGTFDPPHLGHLTIARKAIVSLGVDDLLWMVTPDPPHKTNTRKTDFHARFRMSQLCASDDHRILVSDLENQRPGPHYTLDTITQLKTASPERSFSLLIGGDSLVDLPKWHEPHRILSEIEFLGVFFRHDGERELAEFARNFPDFSSKIVSIKADPITISSSQIRAAIHAGDDASVYLHPKVWEYIQNNGLYMSA